MTILTKNENNTKHEEINAECEANNAECIMHNAELDKDKENKPARGKKKVENKSSIGKKSKNIINDDAENIEADCAGAEDSAEAEIGTDPLESLQNELAEQRDKYLRLAAEYDNYRKRSTKERELIYTDARINAISRLLTVYDNLERALGMECTDEAFYKGVEMIMTQMTEVMEDMGVKKIPAVGEPFNPNQHNAVLTIENPDLGENIIAEEYQKGFMLGDRVIRFSTVVVANNK